MDTAALTSKNAAHELKFFASILRESIRCMAKEGGKLKLDTGVT